MAESKQGRKEYFLHDLAQHGVVQRACAKSDISRALVWRWRKKDKHFAKAYKAALLEGKLR